jgi:hypothetical protein
MVSQRAAQLSAEGAGEKVARGGVPRFAPHLPLATFWPRLRRCGHEGPASLIRVGLERIVVSPAA